MNGLNRAGGQMKKVPVTIAFVALLSTWGIAFGENDTEPVFTPIRHATFVIQSADLTIFVDPVGEVEAFAAYGAPDIILVTDIHGDHLAAELVRELATDKTSIIGPEAVIDKLKAGTALGNGESTSVGKMRIEAIPMYNLTEERLKFHEKGRGNGYVVTVGGKRIYIAGDTEDIPEMRALTDIDYAFVCMNLPYTMTVEQAADAVLEFRPRVVFPYHYRGKGGLSDIEKFQKLVSKDDSIEVRLLKWYE